MVQSNKILTVSYGTFSCTLEGFDDSFGTMKAIAEYFRDLASEDRYFGAEPPQPDAEMLAHIAQKEIARRVEAHRDETGIVLRAQQAAPAAIAEAAPETIREEAAPVESEVQPAQQQPELESDDVHADVADVAVEPATGEAPEAPAEDNTDDAAAFFAKGTEAVAEPEVEEMPVASATPAEDSIAAKLQRIRAVVSKGHPPAEHGFSEDEHADSFVADAPVSAADSLQEAPAAPVPAAPVIEDSQDDADQDGLYAHLDELDRLDDDQVADAADVAAIEEALAEDAEEQDTEDSVAALLADVAAHGAPVQPPAAEQAPVAEAPAAEPEPVAEPAAEAVELEAPKPMAKARVVKVTREEFDAMLAADRGEAPAVPPAEAELDAGESTLSAEDEADLMRELAEVEAEMKGEIAPEEPIIEDADVDQIEEDDDIDSIFADSIDAVMDEDDQDDFAEERAILSGDADADADVSRIMEEADDKLNDPETSDRRSEFAHLRAAMAAGKAEEAAGGSISEAASDDEYREDLARVVRPRRPEASETRERGRRPQEQKPAPLKLVAAQRVDAPASPVQPRRVMSTPAADEDNGKMKFTEYADSVGAVELPELLEAAAAYLSFIEGHDQFSRPQLMTKVRMVEKDQFSREDGLRSFGLLLRDGKIEKTQAGRFTVSDRIGFRPEDMRAAG